MQLLGVAAVFRLFDGLQVAAHGALQGLKDTRVSMGIAMGRTGASGSRPATCGACGAAVDPRRCGGPGGRPRSSSRAAASAISPAGGAGRSQGGGRTRGGGARLGVPDGGPAGGVDDRS